MPFAVLLEALEEIKMKHLLLVFIGVAIYVFCACANDENDYWTKIRELYGKGSPHDRTAVREYLNSLTKDQMLTALRQFSKTVEAEATDEAQLRPMFQSVFITVSLIMSGYYEQPSISEEELDKLPRRSRKKYEEGSVPGPLTEDAFAKLIACISNNKEGKFFRCALAGWATTDDVSPDLSNSQKERLFDTCLSVVSDRQSPEVVRCQCCDAAKEVLRREAWRITYADDVVKELLRTGTPEQKRNLDSLLCSGEIKLSSKTIEQLVPWGQRLKDFRKQMLLLQNDEQEQKSLGEQARQYVIWLERSPLASITAPPDKRAKTNDQ